MWPEYCKWRSKQPFRALGRSVKCCFMNALQRLDTISRGVMVHRFSVSALKVVTVKKLGCYAPSISCASDEFNWAFSSDSTALEDPGSRKWSLYLHFGQSQKQRMVMKRVTLGEPVYLGWELGPLRLTQSPLSVEGGGFVYL